MTDLKVAQAYNAWRVKVDASPMVSPALEIAFKAGFSAAEEGKAELVEAAEALLHAVCGETGFAAAVRAVSGVAYPWPALDIAEADLRAALARVRGEG